MLIVICLVLLVLCGIGGLMMFMPGAFIGAPTRIRLSLFGIIAYFCLVIFSLFPDRFKLVVVRIVGSGMMLASLLLGGNLIYGTVTGKVDLDDRPRRATWGQPRNAAEATSNLVARQAEIRLQVRGPEYTTKVKELVAAQVPQWIVESDEPLVVRVTEKLTYLQVEWDLEEDVLDELPEADSAKIIVQESPKALIEEAAALKASGKFDTVMQERKARYGGGAPAASVPPLEEADKLLEAAKAAWQQGNIQGALASAENARKIRAQHLGANHPKVAQVDQMIATARQKVAAPAATKP